MKQIIAIQGAEGSNHHKVAQNFYGKDVALKECLSFDVLIDALLSKTASQGIMAIENTIAGSIIPNYALIDKYNIHISGEQYFYHKYIAVTLPTPKSMFYALGIPYSALLTKHLTNAKPQ